MAVEEADPAEPVDGGQLPEQRRDSRVARLVPAVGGGVLGHQDEFFDPGGGQDFGLPHQGVEGRLRMGPRIWGMRQKVQRWLHPSAIFR